MEIHKTNYEEERAEKQARYEELAAKNKDLANQQFEEAIKMGEVIPFGQPILVGHHSEKSDRNYRKKIDNKMRKSFETNDKAKHYESKVEGMKHNGAISRDDPEAVKKLLEKIEKEKLVHKTAKDKRKDFRDRKEELIKEMGDREYHSKYYLLEAYMTGATAEIKRCQGRIKEIQALEKADDIDETINGVKLYTAEARIRIEFGYKPDEETRTKLKRHGFRWSPRNQVWQAYIKQWNIDFARELLEGLK